MIVTFLCDNVNKSTINFLHEYIPEKVPWEEKKVRNAQRKDSSCIKIISQLENTRATEKLVPPHILLGCRVLNGTLYILRKIKRSALMDQFLVPYIPDSLMSEAFKLMHSDTTAGHKGPERTLKMFVKNFYNVNERSLINQYCG